jgi:hypothetical protein
MSLHRMIYYCTVMAGWAAFCAWLLTEPLYRSGRDGMASFFVVLLTAGAIGAAVGMSVNVVAGLGNGQLPQLLRRALVGLLGGGLGGIVGGEIGDILYKFGASRAFGWMVMGIGIGMVEGLYDRSTRKVVFGVLGGALGGWIGGFLFNPILQIAKTDSGMASRAASIVVLGLCIGAAISLAQVVLKDAWLTVVDGYRTGRQLNLTQVVTVLGRSDRLPLPFLGPQNQDLDQEHLRIVRMPNGSFQLQDNGSKLGTRVNSQVVTGPVALNDRDIIRLGTNLVRFNVRPRLWSISWAREPSDAVPAAAGQTVLAAAPPPPKLNLAPTNITAPVPPPSAPRPNPESPWSDTTQPPPPATSQPRPWRTTPVPPAPPPPGGKR